MGAANLAAWWFVTVSAQAGATSVTSKSVLEWVRDPCITHSNVLNEVAGASTYHEALMPVRSISSGACHRGLLQLGTRQDR